MASNVPSIVTSLVIRVVIAAPIVWYGARQVNLMGVGVMFCGGLIVIFPLIALLVEGIVGSHMPGGRYRKPQPRYSIPEARRQEGKHNESIMEYHAIIASHPQELKAYVAIMDIYLTDLHEPDQALQVYRLAMDTLKKKEDKEAAARMYHMFKEKEQSPIHIL